VETFAGRARAFVGAAVVVALAHPLMTRGADFAVDTTADDVDAAPGDGSCLTSLGACSLRAAVQEANGLAGRDTITLPAGAFLLTTAGTGEDSAARGDLDVTEALAVTGAGSALTTIDAGGRDRVLHVLRDAPLVLSDLTLTGGVAINGGGVAVNAGGPLDTLTVNRCTLLGNDADSGGAISAGTVVLDTVVVEANHARLVGGAIDANALIASDSRFAGNSSDGGPITDGWGGAIVSMSVDLARCVFEGNASQWGGAAYLRSPLPGFAAASRVVDSTFTANSATRGGGAIVTSHETQLDVVGTTFEANAADVGGVLFSRPAGRISFSDSTFTENDAATDGGAIDMVANIQESEPGGEFSITRCRFEGNRAGNVGGALHAAGSTNLPANTFVVRDSLFDANQAGTEGGAVAVVRSGAESGTDGDDVTLVNCTISGCVAPEASAVVLRGRFGRVRLLSTTITDNVTTNGRAAVLCEPDPPQPPFPYNPSVMTIGSSCLAGNRGFAASDLAGPVTSSGFNLVGEGTGVVWMGDVASHLVGIDPRLGPLQDNGGPTLTHAPLPWSGLIDGVDLAACLDESGAPLIADQRGFVRPVDGDRDALADCDVGAVEVDWGADSDGDGVGDTGGGSGGGGADCAPTDPTVFAPPPEPSIRVARSGAGDDAVVSWTDMTAESGSSTTAAIAGETLDALRTARSADGPCLITGVTGLAWTDTRTITSGGFYYLVKGMNACRASGTGGWGHDSMGTERPACP
jgi:CSLREA domain-containing protein